MSEMTLITNLIPSGKQLFIGITEESTDIGANVGDAADGDGHHHRKRGCQVRPLCRVVTRPDGR